MTDTKPIVGLFIPVYHRDDKVRACFESLLKTDKTCVEWHVAVGFNGGSDELRYYLEMEVPRRDYPWDGYEFVSYNTNIGKPEMVNRLVKRMANCVLLDYVLSYDSDMIAEDPRWLLNFVEAFEDNPKWADTGALAAQQMGNCCHVLNDKVIHTRGNRHYTYISVPNNEGIAGGAILTPYHVWRTLGGYLANRIYGADDAHYALALHQHNLLMSVVDEVKLIHPHGDDQAYSQWKLRAVKDALSADELKGHYR